MTPAGGGVANDRPLEMLGWGLCALALLYAYAIHQGIGPAPDAAARSWYEPRGSLQGWASLAWAFQSTLRAVIVLALPAAGLASGVFLATRSSLARALALSACVAVLLFVFYGVAAPRVWEFFSWRGSAVLALTALSVGFALAAPLLAADWLRLRAPLRVAVYAAACFLVVAFLRNATGTDPELRYSISPWPAVAVFGLETGALFVMLGLAGAALGSAGVAGARQRSHQRALVAISGVGLGIAGPVALLGLASWLGLLAFKADARSLLAAAGVSGMTMAAACTLGVRRLETLRRRSRHLALGAIGIALPLLGGEIWARWDYQRTREHQARDIIDAMERYYAREDLYPDELSDLVVAGDLQGIPKPAIGFGFLYDGAFGYRSFGTSYLLEFPAPRWVECAYTPAYEDEEEEEDADRAGELGESWSCPSNPPELW